MVKRTLVVLGILSLLLTAGTSSAFLGYGFPGAAGGDCGPCPPMYLPVDCPPYPVAKTIVKTWQCKIVGPCPAPGPACGPAACGTGMGGISPGLITSVANLLGMPFDLLFNHCDSVYGCFGGFGGLGKDGPCGPSFGPVPAIVGAVPMVLGAPTVMFGAMW